MIVWSNSFDNGESIPQKYSAYGENLFPHIAWGEVPEGTKSFAVFCHDKDAPTISGFWHLLIFNIPAHIRSIEEGKIETSKGFVVNNDVDFPGWFGPKPPPNHGVHSYEFHVFALPFENIITFMKENLNLDLTQNRGRIFASFVVNTQCIDKAILTGTFEAK